jgi:hypothetical protein
MRRKSGIGLAGLTMMSVAAVSGYLFFVRPWYLRWGTTAEERDQTLPGDDIVKHPKYRATRAITIDVPATAVWPWLVQMGQDRGGFYSYDFLENLVGLNIHSAKQITSEYQHLEEGNKVRFAPRMVFDFAWEVRMIEPERALVLAVPGSSEENIEAGYPHRSWAFILHTLNAHTTRLIIRSRSDEQPGLTGMLFHQMLLEPIHFLMEQKMLRGIKQRAEQINEKIPVQQPGEVKIYIV